MSQHDFDIANQSAGAFRADTNAAIGALGSLNSGPAAPPTTLPDMLWMDTTSSILKMRTTADDAWFSVLYMDQATTLPGLIDDTPVVTPAGVQTGLVGGQPQATWEAGTGTLESLISPAMAKAAADKSVLALASVGWEDVETIYDAALDGPVASTESANLLDGYEYRLIFNALQHDSVANLSMAVRTDDGALTAPLNVVNSTLATVTTNGAVNLQQARVALQQHSVLVDTDQVANGFVGAGLPTAGFQINARYTFATGAAQKIRNIVIAVDVGNLSGGVIKLQRLRAGGTILGAQPYYATFAQGALADTALQPGQAATPAQGALADTARQPGDALGEGQTWQDMTSSRAVNTSYQNTTSRPIEVDITFFGTTAAIFVGVDTASYVQIASHTSSGSWKVTLSAVVPPGHFYKIGTTTLNQWGELR